MVVSEVHQATVSTVPMVNGWVVVLEGTGDPTSHDGSEAVAATNGVSMRPMRGVSGRSHPETKLAGKKMRHNPTH